MTDVEITTSAFALPLPARGTDERYTPHSLTAAWLMKFKSDHTRAAYFRDLADWLAWCGATALDPLTARRADVDAYVRHINTRGAKPPAPSSLARRLSALSSWYRYLISNEITERNPVAAVDRPEFNKDHSTTVGLTLNEVREIRRTAATSVSRQALRNRVVVGILAQLGLRVGELIAADIADLGYDDGHRVLIVHGKGGRDRKIPVPAGALRDLNAYLEERAAQAGIAVDGLGGPLVVTASGKRISESSVFLLVRRLAREAGIPSAEALSPHSLRHSAATAALDSGAALRDVQDLLGHADPRTTRRYDRSRGALDRSPAHRLASLFSTE